MSTGDQHEVNVTPDVFARWSRRIRQSDQAAFAALFQEMHVALLRFAWRYTSDESAAQDIVQEAFMKLWQARETLDDQRSLKAFLFTIVRNLALNHNRSYPHLTAPITEVEHTVSDDDSSIDNQLELTELNASIEEWIAEMPDRRREAFLLSRVHGLSHDEIADIMNLTPHTVNTHIVLALKHLRNRLETLEIERT